MPVPKLLGLLPPRSLETLNALRSLVPDARTVTVPVDWSSFGKTMFPAALMNTVAVPLLPRFTTPPRLTMEMLPDDTNSVRPVAADPVTMSMLLPSVIFTAVKITEGSNMDIVTGSAATGLTEFVSSGNISIVNRGGVVNLGSSGTATVFMSAAGNIVLPKLLQSTGTVTVLASGTKDLSALSVSNDLGGKSPSNFGTGTYLPPSP